MSRILATAVAITAIMALSVGFAVAQESYPADTPADADEQKDAVAPGDIQRIILSGFQPGSSATLVVTGPAAGAQNFGGVWVASAWTITMTETIGADGSVTFAFRIPSDSPEGTATWAVEGIDEEGNAVTITGSFIVDAALPITGEGISRMTLAAGVLLLLGAGLLVGTRRRRQTETPAAA